MGAKNPDRLKSPPMAETAITLAEMHLERWQLQASCRRCGVILRADLGMLIRVHGPDAIWWGRRPKCPVWDCGGELRYAARSVNGGTWVSLADPAPARVVERWKAVRGIMDRGPR